MFRLFLKTLANHNPNPSTFSICRFIQTQSPSIKPNLTDKQSSTVSYLLDSCGLSLQSAIAASKLLEIKNKERSDSVLDLFRSYGFSPQDISSFISRHPCIIVADPVKNLRPKLEFFESTGVALSELPTFVNSCAVLFRWSLENSIVPAYNFLKPYIDVKENPVSTLKIVQSIVGGDFKLSILPKVEILRACGVPQSMIGKLFKQKSRVFNSRLDLFREVVKDVMEMGFDPESVRFVLAVRSIAVLTKPNWERKKEALMGLGWTEKDFYVAFKLKPMFMLTSEKKIREMMDYLVEKVGLTAADVARYPSVFQTSLEKSVIPRWSVLQILISKGMLKEKSDVIWTFHVSKKEFDRKYVTRFKDKVPELVKTYENQISSGGSSKANKDEQNL